MKPLSKATAKLFEPITFPENVYCVLLVDDEAKAFTVCLYSLQKSWSGESYRTIPGREAEKFIQRFVERKRVQAGEAPFCWQIPATDNSVDLLQLFPQERLAFFDEAAETVYQFILARSRVADLNAERVARYKNDKEVPEHYFETNAELPLSGYQQLALVNAYGSPGFGFFMEQGTGKTAPSIALVCNRAFELQERLQAAGENPRMYRAIIVCPNNVRLNWENEFMKFATQPGKITVMRGNEVDRVKNLIDAFTPEAGAIYSAVVCGYETLTKSWEALQMIEWDLALLDEAHYIKSTRTKRFQTAMKLRDKSQQRLVLTGTPITNTALDLYAQFEFMGKGYSGFSSEEAFRRFYGVFETGEGGHESLVGVQNLPFMQERLARYSYIIRKEEALPDLPEKQYDVYEIEMQFKQAEYYREVVEKLSIEIEADLADDSQPRAMTINNVLTKLLRLAQITSGFISWSPIHDELGEQVSSGGVEYFTPNPKIEAIREILAAKSWQEKTIIWACFRPDIAYLEAACQADGIDYVSFHGGTSEDERREAERRFNFDPACKVFIGNPAAGGTGLNLLGYPPGSPEAADTNCNHIIYYSQNWSQTARSQSEDRAHRRGTRTNVRITDLVVPKTIDEEIRARVLRKKMHAMEVSDIRHILAVCLKGFN